ncbi:MAG TPA: MTAP family purine nucleoside phosphorylase [Caldilineae bacterium]|nr:MTAP family purine nucleoside phosphorylase [Caldilineae bacterium]
MSGHAPRTTHHALIIGGTAAYGLDLAPYRPVDDPIALDTPYGPAPTITFLQPDSKRPPVAFCSRHGAGQLARSAAFVNQRAIVWAAKMLGVNAIYSWNGVGAIASHLEVGDLIVPDDFLDFTRTRTTTFDNTDLIAAQEGSAFRPAFHPAARAAILTAASSLRNSETRRVYEAATYVCTEGPRLETASEIALYHRAGADIVGMTLSPEVFLAQEVGIAYASLCYVTNYATGRAGERPPKRDFGVNVARVCLPLLLSASLH